MPQFYHKSAGREINLRRILTTSTTIDEPHPKMKVPFLKSLICLGLAWILLNSTDPAHADTFGSGTNTFDIEFVTIGNPGNAADTSGSPNPAGAVAYSYRMGKFEISEQMIDKANAEGWTRHYEG